MCVVSVGVYGACEWFSGRRRREVLIDWRHHRRLCKHASATWREIGLRLAWRKCLEQWRSQESFYGGEV